MSNDVTPHDWLVLPRLILEKVMMMVGLESLEVWDPPSVLDVAYALSMAYHRIFVVADNFYELVDLEYLDLSSVSAYHLTSLISCVIKT